MTFLLSANEENDFWEFETKRFDCLHVTKKPMPIYILTSLSNPLAHADYILA